MKPSQLKLKLFFIGMLIVAMFANSKCFSQNAKLDSKGNYVQIKAPIDTTGTPTGKTFTTTKGDVYPVLISKSGSLFVVRTSAKGTRYKMYLKTEPKI